MSVDERDPLLATLAKQEGQVTIYATANNLSMVGDAFQKKYGIKVNFYNISTDPLVLRVQQEVDANRTGSDVVDANESALIQGLGNLFYSGLTYDQADQLIPNALGKGLVADRVNLYAVTWNKDQVSDADVPATFGDLADAKYKGKLFTAESDGGWYAGLIQYYVAKGKSRADAQALVDSVLKNAAVTSDHGTLVSLVAAGQYNFALDAQSSTVLRSMDKGAPLQYQTADKRVVEPVVLLPAAMGVLATAPHPAAALLFLDYTLSVEGQTILSDNGNPASRQGIDPIIKALPAGSTTTVDVSDYLNDPSYDSGYKAATSN